MRYIQTDQVNLNGSPNMTCIYKCLSTKFYRSGRVNTLSVTMFINIVAFFPSRMENKNLLETMSTQLLVTNFRNISNFCHQHCRQHMFLTNVSWSGRGFKLLDYNILF
jgi:hypothetical protein